MSRIVLIAAATEGYRRGGLKFGKQPIEVNLDELEDGSAVAITTDPNLTIKPLEMTADCTECHKRIEELEAQNAELQAQLNTAKKPPAKS